MVKTYCLDLYQGRNEILTKEQDINANGQFHNQLSFSLNSMANITIMIAAKTAGTIQNV
jgi:hypothetical protein